MLNDELREAGYEHASSKLKDVFDAVGLAWTEDRTGTERSTVVLTAERSISNPPVPRWKRVGRRVGARRAAMK